MYLFTALGLVHPFQSDVAAALPLQAVSPSCLLPLAAVTSRPALGQTLFPYSPAARAPARLCRITHLDDASSFLSDKSNSLPFCVKH